MIRPALALTLDQALSPVSPFAVTCLCIGMLLAGFVAGWLLRDSHPRQPRRYRYPAYDRPDTSVADRLWHRFDTPSPAPQVDADAIAAHAEGLRYLYHPSTVSRARTAADASAPVNRPGSGLGPGVCPGVAHQRQAQHLLPNVLAFPAAERRS